MNKRVRTLIGWLVTVVLAAVVVVGLIMGDSSAQDRVDGLGSRIKCPVCQGEAIGDSPSETAQAMVEIVKEKVEAGETDSQIVDYFTARYGDDATLLRLAASLEREKPWVDRKPRLPGSRGDRE